MIEINTNLYKLTQFELFDYLKKELDDMNIQYIVSDGNIVSLNHIGTPCFVSHMDTVNDRDMKKELLFDNNLNTMYRKDGILGADDRAGINLIMNHCKDINFIFTRDEEIGALGMESLDRKLNIISLLENWEIPCCIELDRKGNNSILGAKHGYCSRDLQSALQRVLPDHIDDVGIYTDIDKICDKIPCCNLSIGYQHGHSIDEYLDIEYFLFMDKKIMELNKISGKFEINHERFIHNATKSRKRSKKRSIKVSAVCDICGYEHDEVHYLNSLMINACNDCLDAMQDDMDRIRSFYRS